MEIRGNVFVVTGGASGLGGATSRLLASAGGKVVIADLQADKGEALARELGADARFVRCDVSSEADGKTAIAAALALGTLRGLVNCAGIAAGEKTIGKDGPHKLESFARVIGINLIGTFNMIRLAADAMAKTGADARRRAWRHREHGVGCRVRRTDRPGRLLRLESRRRRNDASDRA